MYSSHLSDIGKLDVKRIFKQLSPQIKNVIKVAGVAAGTTALTQMLIKKGMSPEEAEAAANTLIRGEGPMEVPSPSFMESTLFGFPVPYVLGGGAALAIILYLTLAKKK